MGASTIWAGRWPIHVEGDPEEVMSLLNYSPYVRVERGDDVTILSRDKVDLVSRYSGDAPAASIERFVPRQLVGSVD